MASSRDAASSQEPAWHALAATEVASRLVADERGLSTDEAVHRQVQQGPNALPDAPRRPAWRRFLAHFHNTLIYLLIAAGLVAYVFGHGVDALVIFGVVLVNAGIGFVQEGRAERAMDAIARMLSPRARVMRDGHWQELPAEHLVTGDRVLLKAGDRIPADLRLIEVHGLRIDQAALTGESAPVAKQIAVQAQATPLAERSGMAYAGTLAVGGQGEGYVVAIGAATELGRISGMLGRVKSLEETPLIRDINRFGRRLSVLVLAVTASMMLLSAWIHDVPVMDGLIAGIAVIVAAIPEGLPAIITITLAIGVQRMAGRMAIVRRLPAVETLGAVEVVCTDKTGTLTRNELVATRVALATGLQGVGEVGIAPLLEAAVLCNDAPANGHGGDPLERALVGLALQQGMDVAALRKASPRTALLPFSSTTKFMATAHAERLCLKGAPEGLIARCARQWQAGGESVIDPAYWRDVVEQLARDGLRVLAIAGACRPTGADDEPFPAHVIDGGLLLYGLVAFADPPRPEVPAAVSACRDAGITVKMITGDHAATAASIAEELGILRGGGVLTGVEIDALDTAGLAAQVDAVHVYARTTPEHKLRLVEALQAKGRVVAMTGDGVNDAPALKRADIGVAMGIKGTEAARQASGIVLADDNFATIISGVEEGRGIHDNIRKALLFILPTNVAQAAVVFLAMILGVDLPVTPVQILWVNMVTSVTLALALAFEPLEGAVMRRPPRRPGASLIDGFVAARILWVGAFVTAGVFWLHGSVLAATGDEALARTAALNALVLCQVGYLFNARRWLAPGWTREALTANRWAWVSVGVLIVLQGLLCAWPPAQAVFGTTLPAVEHWIAGILLALVLFLVVEVEKALLRRSQQRARRSGEPMARC